MLERTIVYVDTSYLLASFYNSWETGARSQLEIDLPEVVAILGNMIKDQLGQPIHRQFWYDGIPDSGPHRYQRSLRSCDGVQLRTGQLIEWGDRRTQKGVDTRLVADMVVAGHRREVSDFVLVSGDADMIPGVQEASDNGVRVHLYGFGWDSMSAALRHSCDTTTILDPREDFADAMQLQVLEGPLPPSIRERPIADGVPDEQGGMTPVPGGRPLQNPAESQAPRPAERPYAPLTPTGDDAEPGADSEQSERSTEAASEATSEVTSAMAKHPQDQGKPAKDAPAGGRTPSAPKPSMMASRRKLRSRYVPLPEEVWSSAGFQTPFDVGQQYATWWFENAATVEQRDSAHQLSGGGLPPEIDRPLLQFACETLHEYTLSESQRVSLRDGFHSGIRGVLISVRRLN
ncbi:NYN domain-containing protein [Corynebacterium doosanense]|uniref:NYN domain-containing protein n=1 Tax=Corynebacterium doosanense CAU 212 = DSM 45436 TaxID=558173 RepID=A0A097IIU5_9CORY|nr:NYN domain-containing protein [Corynebacterium doosanense]AIT62055.1 hypothetical protein CDOO_12890 [Corynebacterium doosanense CAU 212 = DSM 45436]